MLCTPILVDRLKLTYPSGLAVANILRALTDKQLLKRSIANLGSGMGLGILGATLVEHVKLVGRLSLSMSTLGAGIIVGSRIAVPGLVMAVIGAIATPTLRALGWLGPDDPFRKIGFLMGLAMILGAAVVDLSLIAWQALARLRETRREPEPTSDGGMGFGRLLAWVLVWAIAIVVVGSLVLGRSPGFLAFAVALFRTAATSRAAFWGMKRSWADASSTVLPTIDRVTRFAFRVEPRRYLAVAETRTVLAVLYLSAVERSVCLPCPR